MTTNEIDQAKAAAFTERMVTILNDGALALMTSLGHRTGLFDTLAILGRERSLARIDRALAKSSASSD